MLAEVLEIAEAQARDCMAGDQVIARRLRRRKIKPAMEAQRDSPVIAARVAIDQLEAMGAAAFDIGSSGFMAHAVARRMGRHADA
jgi:hypothetical protein